ncbi:hypothetical protein VC279_23725 [Xanthomonas sp. WHRI 10064A]|uniref:hypothetical protein n=1 Tax=unclassified Xanthomonas TaxID=2643310 RepID=UPI002B2352C1|nr:MULTISPECIES: hypothetical protein [unclassified Xanthomonas]MEA9590134.1 hypothetical protein [Xanthomonas sp. WHRI 10064B]MEA9617598.1 hypothetical protein [Xanthomonas sp. WHRI 10064A]
MHKAWLLVLLAVSAIAHASPSDDDAAVCRNGLFTSSPSAFSLAKVVVPRLYLLKDSDGCPGKSKAACRQRSYVVKGDVVVLAQHRDGYTCAFYPNKVGGSAGWVAERNLQAITSTATPPARAWNGHWHDGDNTLQLTASGDGSVAVNGDAYWPSANPSPEQTPGGPHIGAVTARSTPNGNRLEVSEDDCTVCLQLLGELLIVADNLQCGGANVSFSGVYRQDHARRP